MTPAKLVMNRKLVSRLDLPARLDLGRSVGRKEIEQKQQHDYHAKEQLLNLGDLMYERIYGGERSGFQVGLTKKRDQCHSQ